MSGTWRMGHFFPWQAGTNLPPKSPHVPRTSWGEEGMTMLVSFIKPTLPIRHPTNYFLTPLNHHPTLVKCDRVPCPPMLTRRDRNPRMGQDSSSSSCYNLIATIRGESSLCHMESLNVRAKRTPKTSSSLISSLCKWITWGLEQSVTYPRSQTIVRRVKKRVPESWCLRSLLTYLTTCGIWVSTVI